MSNLNRHTDLSAKKENRYPCTYPGIRKDQCSTTQLKGEPDARCHWDESIQQCEMNEHYREKVIANLELMMVDPCIILDLDYFPVNSTLFDIVHLRDQEFVETFDSQFNQKYDTNTRIALLFLFDRIDRFEIDVIEVIQNELIELIKKLTNPISKLTLRQKLRLADIEAIRIQKLHDQRISGNDWIRQADKNVVETPLNVVNRYLAKEGLRVELHANDGIVKYIPPPPLNFRFKLPTNEQDLINWGKNISAMEDMQNTKALVDYSPESVSSFVKKAESTSFLSAFRSWVGWGNGKSDAPPTTIVSRKSSRRGIGSKSVIFAGLFAMLLGVAFLGSVHATSTGSSSSSSSSSSSMLPVPIMQNLAQTHGQSISDVSQHLALHAAVAYAARSAVTGNVESGAIPSINMPVIPTIVKESVDHTVANHILESLKPMSMQIYKKYINVLTKMYGTDGLGLGISSIESYAQRYAQLLSLQKLFDRADAAADSHRIQIDSDTFQHLISRLNSEDALALKTYSAFIIASMNVADDPLIVQGLALHNMDLSKIYSQPTKTSVMETLEMAKDRLTKYMDHFFSLLTEDVEYSSDIRDALKMDFTLMSTLVNGATVDTTDYYVERARSIWVTSKSVTRADPQAVAQVLSSAVDHMAYLMNVKTVVRANQMDIDGHVNNLAMLVHRHRVLGNNPGGIGASAIVYAFRMFIMDNPFMSMLGVAVFAFILSEYGNWRRKMDNLELPWYWRVIDQYPRMKNILLKIPIPWTFRFKQHNAPRVTRSMVTTETTTTTMTEPNIEMGIIENQAPMRQPPPLHSPKSIERHVDNMNISRSSPSPSSQIATVPETIIRIAENETTSEASSLKAPPTKGKTISTLPRRSKRGRAASSNEIPNNNYDSANRPASQKARREEEKEEEKDSIDQSMQAVNIQIPIKATTKSASKTTKSRKKKK